jgi:hypothetical protein
MRIAQQNKGPGEAKIKTACEIRYVQNNESNIEQHRNLKKVDEIIRWANEVLEQALCLHRLGKILDGNSSPANFCDSCKIHPAPDDGGEKHQCDGWQQYESSVHPRDPMAP